MVPKNYTCADHKEIQKNKLCCSASLHGSESLQQLWLFSCSKTRHQNSLKSNPTGPLLCSDLSVDVAASCQCPCNYFGERIWFNMSSANEPRQGMLQASSSWLTCTWHNVPCADRCRVAVWSSGFLFCEKIRRDWCCRKADSINYESLIKGCRKWFILPQNMVIQPHLSPRLQGPYCAFAHLIS